MSEITEPKNTSNKLFGYSIQLLGFSMIYLSKVLFDNFYSLTSYMKDGWKISAPTEMFRFLPILVFTIGVVVIFYGSTIFIYGYWWNGKHSEFETKSEAGK